MCVVHKRISLSSNICMTWCHIFFASLFEQWYLSRFISNSALVTWIKNFATIFILGFYCIRFFIMSSFDGDNVMVMMRSSLKMSWYVVASSKLLWRLSDSSSLAFCSTRLLSQFYSRVYFSMLSEWKNY